jgi:hypothetical protein
MGDATYKTKITSLECYPEYEGKTNVVRTVRWTLSATDGVSTYTYPGKTEIRYNPAAPWLEYGSLNEDVVLNWISRDATNEMLAVRASLALNFSDAPSSESKPLPW